MTRADLLSMTEKMRFAGELVEQLGTNEQEIFAAAKAKLGQLDEDTDYFLHTFIAGKNYPCK